MATEYASLERAIKSPPSLENPIGLDTELNAGLDYGLNVDLDDNYEAPPIAASPRPVKNPSR